MKEQYLAFLCCPECRSDLSLSVDEQEGDRIKSGNLACSNCSAHYAVTGFIPRFVQDATYADSFGPQWKAFAKSQLDTDEIKESEIRFDSEMGWTAAELIGKTAVEIGSGAGRFVDIVSRRGATLAVGMDITDAVSAARDNLGHRENVFFVQGDIFRSPLKEQQFDFAYSIGVLHHTPDPHLAFDRMVRLAKEAGRVGVSLYEISLYHRPNRNTLKVVTMDLLWAINIWRCEFFRLFTTKLPHSVMLAYCKTVIPVLHVVNKIPLLRYIRYLFPSTCYRHLPVICSMVDTMDTYSTKIVHQYRGKDVFQWFLKLGLQDIVLHNSRAGWVSITAHVGTASERAGRSSDLKQPAAPGEVGFIGS